MKLLSYIVMTFLIGLVGCSTVEPKIPVGVYRERAITPNFIEVASNQARVHIEGVDDRDKDETGLAFDYVLYSNGRMFLVVSRSVELLHGYPALEYRWDGERIVAKDAKSNLHWEFVK